MLNTYRASRDGTAAPRERSHAAEIDGCRLSLQAATRPRQWNATMRVVDVGRVLSILLVAMALPAAAVGWQNARWLEPRLARMMPVTTPASPTSTDSLQPLVPDSLKTPGATLDVTAADICVAGYSRKVRHVPVGVKRAVYQSYGIPTPRPHRYEIDHLISLELGGSNSVRNLWPESYETSPWNARVKDALENELHRRVCAGTLDLATAQRKIARNWIAAYQEYVHAATPRRGRR